LGPPRERQGWLVDPDGRQRRHPLARTEGVVRSPGDRSGNPVQRLHVLQRPESDQRLQTGIVAAVHPVPRHVAPFVLTSQGSEPTMPNNIFDRSIAGARKASIALAAAGALYGMAACSNTLDVELPGRIPSALLGDPTTAPTLSASVVADFECAFSNYVATTST